VSSFALNSVPCNARYTARSVRLIVELLFGLSLMFGMAGEATAQNPTPITCTSGNVPAQDLLQPPPAVQPDLRIEGVCTVQSGKKYFYANVNILNKGNLEFVEGPEPVTDFWASSIIIENGGAMTAGTPPDPLKNDPGTPYGLKGGRLTIHLYGKNLSVWDPTAGPPIVGGGNAGAFTTQNVGALCKSPPGTPTDDNTPAPCGIPQTVWEDNGASLKSLPGGVSDFFYQYGPLYGDGQCTDGSVWDNGKCASPTGSVGYFGVKTLAVSFGGTLALYGYKGASYDATTDDDHTSSGVSWIRLAEDLVPGGAPSLTLAKDPKGPGMGRIEARWSR
jgi:cell migration-inducing and hyaluronan-binding protein